jgi:hypothetical protein
MTQPTSWWCPGADHQLIFLCDLRNMGGIVIYGSINEATHGSMDRPLMMHSCLLVKCCAQSSWRAPWVDKHTAMHQNRLRWNHGSAQQNWDQPKLQTPHVFKLQTKWWIPLAARTSCISWDPAAYWCSTSVSWLVHTCIARGSWLLWRTSSSCSSKKVIWIQFYKQMEPQVQFCSGGLVLENNQFCFQFWFWKSDSILVQFWVS